MAEVLTIGGVDRSANLYRDSLKIEQAAGEFTAVCSFQLTDAAVALAIDTRDTVTIVDNSVVPNETLFAGEVVNVDEDLLSTALDGRRLSVTCQDYNILVEEALVTSEEAYTAQADSDIIDDLFSTYRADINSVAYVATLDASMDISFVDVTLRQALQEICGRTGGRWYVDEDKNLHYFSSEANVAAWFLSDTPDNATSFPYQKLRTKMDATTIVNQVLVVGKEIRDSYEDAASVAAYGARPALLVDTRIETQAELDARGAAILGEWSEPRLSYEVTTRKTGLRAGMDVRLVCGTWALDETLTVRRLTIYWQGGHRFYNLELGDGIATAVTTSRGWIDRLRRIDNLVVEIDDTVFDTDPPSVPTFTAGNLSTGVDLDADGHQIVYIQATWGLVSDADLSYYQIQISTSSDFSGYTITRNQTAGGDRIERFVGILGSTLYYARVRAVDWVGNASAWSTTRSITSSADTTPPADPTGFTATATPASVHLLWNANTEPDLRHYELQRREDGGAYAGTLATVSINFFIDNTCTAGQAYWYRIRAVDTSGNASNWVEIVAAVTPDPISGDWTDLGLLGWTHDLVFSASDEDTVAWAAGDINLPSGTTYNIVLGNTGDMLATTYIYLDTAVSVVALQTTTTASAATGANKLLIAAAAPSGEVGKNAPFQVFGGEGIGVFITADNIAANTISANEIAANTITAAEIAAGTITANEIAANTITGDRIAANTITAANIAAATITATELNVATLSAISADMGTITAGTVTGATIRTAAAGERIVLDSVNGIQAYNAGGTQTVSILPSGAGWIGVGDQIAWNTAGGLTVDGGVLVDGTVVATAFTNTIGQPLFSAADGLLLLGPYGSLTTTAWRSSRGQVASISGAFHDEQGPWLGTRGMVIEQATTNYQPNPVFGAWTGSVPTGWTSYNGATLTQATSYVRADEYSCRIQNGGASAFRGIYDDVTGLSNGTSYRVSVWVYVIDGSAYLAAYDGGTFNNNVSDNASTPGWHRLEVSKTATAGGIRVGLFMYSAGGDCYVDGVQVEALAYATSLCWGGAGNGYSWSGSEHASTSSRTATSLTVSTPGAIDAGTGTISIWFQMPHDAGTSGLSTTRGLFRWWDAYNTESIYISLDTTLSNVYLMSWAGSGANVNISASLSGALQGEWHHVVATWDTVNGAAIYLDGELADEDASYSEPSISATTAQIGYVTAQFGGTIGELAILATELDAGQIAGLYAFNRPLIDAGALDKPGIYITDGRFRLLSSETGARTEIDVDGIKAYSSSAQTVEIATTGDVAFGSDLSAPETISMLVLAEADTYNGEALGAGDILFGCNTAGYASILWDVSAKQLKFRSGTTTTLYIGTDGSLYAGGGYIKMNENAHLFFDVSTATRGIVWKNDFDGGDDDVGYINVSNSSYDMEISTGGDDISGWQDLLIRNRSSSGTTRTPLQIDAANKQIEIYGSSGATLAVRNNGDGDWPALYVQQVSNNRAVAHFDQDHGSAPVLRLDGPTGSPSGIVGYIKINVNGSDYYFAYYS